MDNGITPVLPIGAGYNNGGFGGNGFDGIWALAILALLFNGGWGGFGNNGFANAIGYENLATSNEVQRGFDNQNAMANQREILAAVTSGTAQSVAATNQTFHDTLSVFNDKYSELQRDIAALGVGQANLMAKQSDCCCSIQRAIDGVNYNNAMNTASINANTTAGVQKILDTLSANKIDELQSKISALELAQATSNVVRYPNGYTYNAGPSPFCNAGCGCGCGNL